jgi:L-amino acid N-acyltransferase YncA
MPEIRPSRDEDLPAICAIYGHHVLYATGTFETVPPTEAEMAARRADVLAKGLPYLVVEDAGQVLGFAYCQWFKPRPAYRFSRPRPINQLLTIAFQMGPADLPIFQIQLVISRPAIATNHPFDLLSE